MLLRASRCSGFGHTVFEDPSIIYMYVLPMPRFHSPWVTENVHLYRKASFTFVLRIPAYAPSSFEPNINMARAVSCC